MNSEDIRISDLLLTLLKRWKLIVVMTLVGCGLGLILNSISFVQGSYTSFEITTSIAVIPRASTGVLASGSDHFTSDDYQLSEDMAEAVRYVLYSDRVLQAAIDRVRLINVKPKDVYDNLNITRVNETQILELTLW